LLYDANKGQQFADTKFDLCIVGAGPAGITLAIEMASAGTRICLLDAGDEHYSIESQELYKPQYKAEFYEDTTFNRLRMLGGSSNHWENNTSEFMPNDFLKKDWIPNSGWPISYEDVGPFYIRAAIYCQTDTDEYDSQKWHERLNRTDPLINVEGMITGIGKASLPPTRFYDVHKSKLHSLRNITVVKNANIIDVTANMDISKITSATFSNYKNVRFEIDASKFVLAMGGIENARMLLIFNEKYDNKLGNSNQLVGRYFMDHPLLRAAKLYSNTDKDMGLLTEQKVVGRKVILGFMQHTDESILANKLINLRMPIFKASSLQLSDGIESMHVLKEAISQGDLPENILKHLLNTIKDADEINESIIRKLFNTKVLSYVDEFEEQLPHFDNRIALGYEKDRFGLKKHTVHWRFHDEDFALAWESLKSVASQLAMNNVGRLRIMEEFQQRLQNEKLYVSHHHMGTTRMAENATEGVVDSNCKVFNTANLYVAGSSVFTTGSHVPPTLTLVALSIRLANHFKAEKGVLT